MRRTSPSRSQCCTMLHEASRTSCRQSAPPGDRLPTVPGDSVLTPSPKALRRAEAWLRERGQNPTDAAVAGVLIERQRTSRNAKDAAQRAARLSAVVKRMTRPPAGPNAAAFVAEYRRARAEGPTWAELGEHMGWPRFARYRIVKTLAEKKWLTFDTGDRSLRPGPVVRGVTIRGVTVR